MKKILTLTLILFVKLISAQSFTQGDLTVYIDVSFNHDSTQCKSFGFTTYLINVQNSAIGDTLKIKDAFDNILIFSEINTTGQNP